MVLVTYKYFLTYLICCQWRDEITCANERILTQFVIGSSQWCFSFFQRVSNDKANQYERAESNRMVILGAFISLANGLLRFSYISLPCYLQCLQNPQCFFRRAVLSLILRERQIEVIGVTVVCNYIKPMIPVIVVKVRPCLICTA